MCLSNLFIITIGTKQVLDNNKLVNDITYFIFTNVTLEQ